MAYQFFTTIVDVGNGPDEKLVKPNFVHFGDNWRYSYSTSYSGFLPRNLVIASLFFSMVQQDGLHLLKQLAIGSWITWFISS